MSKVFIDTNIFLRFYKVNTDNLVTIFKDISKLKTSIVLVDQVSDEFLRNRDNLFSEQINKLGTKYKSNPNLTPFIKSLEEFSELADAGKAVVKKHEKLVNKLKHIKDNIEEDTVYKNFYTLYNDSALTIYERTDDIIDKAHRRMLIGNPPIDSKKNTIGDQIIWETLISNLEDDLIFITDDNTYRNNISFLKNEYATKVNRELIVTDEVSFALKKIGEKPSEELIEFEKYNMRVFDPRIVPYNKSPIESVFVNLRNFKHWFLDILDVDIYYEDGTEVQTELSEDPQFSIFLNDFATTRKDSEMYELVKNAEIKFKNKISSLIEKDGHGKVDTNDIEYDVVEYIEPSD